MKDRKGRNTVKLTLIMLKNINKSIEHTKAKKPLTITAGRTDEGKF